MSREMLRNFIMPESIEAILLTRSERKVSEDTVYHRARFGVFRAASRAVQPWRTEEMPILSEVVISRGEPIQIEQYKPGLECTLTFGATRDDNRALFQASKPALAMFHRRNVLAVTYRSSRGDTLGTIVYVKRPSHELPADFLSLDDNATNGAFLMALPAYYADPE